MGATTWISAAVATLGAAASIAGLFRYFALQHRASDEGAADPSPPAEGWMPVLGNQEDGR